MGMSVGGLDNTAWHSTWRHRTIPEKLLLFGGIVVLSLVLPPWPALPLLFAVCLILTRPAGVPVRRLLRYTRAPALFIVIGAASTAVSLDLVQGGLALHADAIVRAGEIAARSLTASVAMLLLASTTPITAMLDWLRHRGLPAQCLDVVAVMYRLTFVLLDSLACIRQAQTSRLGYSTVRRSLHSTSLLTAAVLTRSWSQARRLEIGLAGRDFGQSLPALDRTDICWPFMVKVIGLLALVAGISLGLDISS